MKYFAVRHEQADAVNKYIQSIGHNNGPACYCHFVLLFRHTLTDEDFVILKLKYDILTPTQEQLRIVAKLYNIDLDLVE